MSIKLFLFDLDGTLVDTAPDLVYAINLVRISHGLPALADEILRPMASKGAPGLVGTAFSISPDHPDFSQLKEEFLANYKEHLAAASRPFDQVVEMLDALHNNGIRTGIFTNKYVSLAEGLIQGLGIRDRFDLLLGSDSEGCAMKPAPDAFHTASRLLKIPTSDMLYAGDDRRDVIASHAAGLECAAVRWGYLDSDPSTWHADFIADSPLELVSWATKKL